jgi:hypothetical protein
MKMISSEVYERICDALKPFADMHRKDCDLNETALQRGTSSDLTVLTSRDFETAFNLLKELDSSYENASYY